MHKDNSIGKWMTRFDVSLVLNYPVDTGRKLNYIRRLEDVLVVFWTSYVRPVYILCLRDNNFVHSHEINLVLLFLNLKLIFFSENFFYCVFNFLCLLIDFHILMGPYSKFC